MGISLTGDHKFQNVVTDNEGHMASIVQQFGEVWVLKGYIVPLYKAWLKQEELYKKHPQARRGYSGDLMFLYFLDLMKWDTSFKLNSDGTPVVKQWKCIETDASSDQGFTTYCLTEITGHSDQYPDCLACVQNPSSLAVQSATTQSSNTTTQTQSKASLKADGTALASLWTWLTCNGFGGFQVDSEGIDVPGMGPFSTK